MVKSFVREAFHFSHQAIDGACAAILHVSQDQTVSASQIIIIILVAQLLLPQAQEDAGAKERALATGTG